ncbi:peptidyl-prolyl cis-trans isomerase [Sutcliffiella horikoshii]|uniref:peptidyl-prolyl cis-trans isomerase n=1 Tax=Sutcliffiella horikoshii TaxID=79883 RepID=UPI0007D0709C|nr:peptidyl-prolyl cis-trans isomerase [Sutcliffiella horikoshii]MCM3620594.1 peptidyl-prolyl cis-trans isomerase [Sutcliffiella horikoshii]
MNQKRRLKQKWVWNIIFGLVIINCLTLALVVKQSFSLKDAAEASAFVNGQENIVATVGDTVITRKDMLQELEGMYGQEMLTKMVNKEVVNQIAKKYKVTVSEQSVDREWKMIKTMYSRSPMHGNSSEELVKEQIRSSLLLEELLVKDVEIPESVLESFYQENKQLYTIEDAFHLSHIILETKEEAETVVKELEDGSNFTSLAMEVSSDELTANQGGDLGFLTHETQVYPPAYLTEAAKLEEKSWSDPISVDGKYAVIFLHEKMDGVTYSFEDVKDQIRRQMAMEQMDGSVDASIFWDEVGVEWNLSTAQ